MKKINSFLVLLICLMMLFLVAGCGKEKEPEKTEETHTYEIILAESIEINIGEEADLSFKYLIDNKETEIDYKDFSIRSANTDIAYIDEGKIITIEVGETKLTITLKSDKTVTAECKIIVKEKPVEQCPITITFPDINSDLSYGDMETIELHYECNGKVEVKFEINNDTINVYEAEPNVYKVVANNKGEATLKFILSSSTDKVEKEYKFYINSRYGNIIYDLDGGVLGEGSPDKYEEGCETQLVDPTKEGKKFLGWSIGSKNTNYVTLIDASKTGDITLYANWK